MTKEQKKLRREAVHALQAEARKHQSLAFRACTTVPQQRDKAKRMTQQAIRAGVLETSVA